MADPGEAPPPGAPLLLDQTEAVRAEKILGGDWATPPPPPPPSSILVSALTFLNFVNRKQVLLMK